MAGQDQRELDLIQAIKNFTGPACWSETSGALSMLHAVLAFESRPPRYTNQLATIVATLRRSLPREQIGRELDRPSMQDIAPPLNGLDTP